MRERQAGRNSGAAIARLRRQMVAAVKENLAGAPPRPPEAGLRLWLMFSALSGLRRWTEAGPDALQPSEVSAWAQLNRVSLPPHHVAILAAMDAAWLEWVGTPEAERVVGVMTAARFDAMFGG